MAPNDVHNFRITVQPLPLFLTRNEQKLLQDVVFHTYEVAMTDADLRGQLKTAVTTARTHLLNTLKGRYKYLVSEGWTLSLQDKKITVKYSGQPISTKKTSVDGPPYLRSLFDLGFHTPISTMLAGSNRELLRITVCPVYQDMEFPTITYYITPGFTVNFHDRLQYAVKLGRTRLLDSIIPNVLNYEGWELVLRKSGTRVKADVTYKGSSITVNGAEKSASICRPPPNFSCFL